MISYFGEEEGRIQPTEPKTDKQKFVKDLLSVLTSATNLMGTSFDHSDLPRFPREHFEMGSTVWSKEDRIKGAAWTFSGRGHNLSYPTTIVKELHLIGVHGDLAMVKLADSTVPSAQTMQIFSVLTLLSDENPVLARLIERAKTVQVCLADAEDNRMIYEFRRRGEQPLVPGEFPLDELMVP
jgi:hypothetical protein